MCDNKRGTIEDPAMDWVACTKDAWMERNFAQAYPQSAREQEMLLRIRMLEDVLEHFLIGLTNARDLIDVVCTAGVALDRAERHA